MKGLTGQIELRSVAFIASEGIDDTMERQVFGSISMFHDLFIHFESIKAMAAIVKTMTFIADNGVEASKFLFHLSYQFDGVSSTGRWPNKLTTSSTATAITIVTTLSATNYH